MKLTATIALALTCMLLAMSSIAYAASPTQDAYSGLLGEQEQIGGDSGDNPTATSASPKASTSGTLPFTGVELGLIAMVGAGLLGTGLVVRRAARAPKLDV